MSEREIEEHLAAGRLEEAAEVLRKRFESASPDFCVAVCRDSQLDPARSPGDPYVAALSEVELDTAYWTVFDRERAYARESYHRNFANSPLVSQRVSPQRDAYLVMWKRATVSTDEPCVLVGSDENYSHWVLRSLLKLWLVEGDPALRELRWVVGSQLSGFQREYLELLGVPESRLLRVPANAVVHFRTLYVPTQMIGNRGFLGGVRWLRAKLQAFLCPPSEASERIYVSRADQPRRRLLNEDEIFAMLAPLGFRRVLLAGMPVAEQAATFSRARWIVGPHGAGLTNLVFSSEGARVVEIGSTNILQQNHFRWMAPLLGQRILTVESDEYVMDEPRRSEVQPVNWDYRVPVGRVREAALSLLA